MLYLKHLSGQGKIKLSQGKVREFWKLIRVATLVNFKCKLELLCQGGQWIPFPLFGYGKKTGNNDNLRRKWILCKSSHLTQLHNRSREPMAPFERASMTSYSTNANHGRASMTSHSTLMVTMALSASVSKLQPSEICLTSILTSPGHSRSKPMTPFERASMTSYSTLMVTMALSASVSKLQPPIICLTSILTSLGQSQWRHLKEHLWLPIQL